MKHSRIIPVAALLVGVLVPASGRAANRAAPSAIARYAQINREVGRYTVVKRKLSGYSPGGGTLRAFFLHGSPRKMIVHHYGDNGQAIEEYYFWNNHLFFVLRDVFTDDGPRGKEKRTVASRFYFSNDKLVRFQENRKSVPLSSQEAKDYEESLVMMARELLQTARS